MVRRLCVCLFILFTTLHVKAIEAVVSHTIFYLPDPAQKSQSAPSLELYWQINPGTVHYKTTPQKTIIAQVRTDIIFMNDSGIFKEDHFILETPPRNSVEELATHSIIDLRRYFMRYGNVRMKIKITDLFDTTNRFSFSDSFVVVQPFIYPYFSGMQLLDTILQSPLQTAFLKNGQQQVPACSDFIDDNKSVLHYYAELYGADRISKGDYPLVQKVFITKKENDQPYIKFLRKDTIKGDAVALVSGSLSIATLPSGNYYLQATLENSVQKVIATTGIFFQRLNKHPVSLEMEKKVEKALQDTSIESINVLNLGKTFIAKYTLPQVRGILKMLLPFSDYTATQTINGFLKKPDEMYMRYYIYNYFADQNKKDPGKAWKDFTEKILEVNKKFSVRGTPGYETDRGFMYLRYGAPSEIITVESEQGAQPYEIWQYNTLTEMNRKSVANAVFLFYKPNNMISDYKLLHSTVTGEIQNPSWRTYLFANTGNATSGNSRAEQYIGNR